MQVLHGFSGRDPSRFVRAAGQADLFYVRDLEVPAHQVSSQYLYYKCSLSIDLRGQLDGLQDATPENLLLYFVILQRLQIRGNTQILDPPSPTSCPLYAIFHLPTCICCIRSSALRVLIKQNTNNVSLCVQIIEGSLPKVPVEVGLVPHWLAIEGVQPRTAEHAPIDRHKAKRQRTEAARPVSTRPGSSLLSASSGLLS